MKYFSHITMQDSPKAHERKLKLYSCTMMIQTKLMKEMEILKKPSKPGHPREIKCIQKLLLY